MDAVRLKTSLKVARTHSPIYAGGHAAATADGRFLVSTVNCAVNILDLSSGESRSIQGVPDDEVTCFAVKPDGKHILVAYRSLLLCYYDFATGAKLRSWK
ncbi:Transducin (beta)-like 3, partial [Cladochytrium tenue]